MRADVVRPRVVLQARLVPSIARSSVSREDEDTIDLRAAVPEREPRDGTLAEAHVTHDRMVAEAAVRVPLECLGTPLQREPRGKISHGNRVKWARTSAGM